MYEALGIALAFFFGLGVRQIGLPPLVGFLAAGFALHVMGSLADLPDRDSEIVEQVSHFGVLLLLFAVGLKLRLGQVAQPLVLGGALLHFALSCLLLTVGLNLLLGLDPYKAFLLAIALSFSSTVFSAKMLEARRELGTFYGRTAIGILILQDLIALGVLALLNGDVPSVWALGVFALPLARPLLHWLLDFAGHDELLVLLGMLLALVIGGAGFELVGLSSEIGALAMGLMMSTHRRAKELSEAIWSLKEVFLVGFFLQIGMSGLPDWSDLGLALLALAVLPLKGVIFFLLLIALRLRARNAFMAAASLTAYSEFGLIVSAHLAPEFLVSLALAVSLSFVFAAPLNRAAQSLFERFEHVLVRLESERVHHDEQPTDLGNAHVLILGMGRTGTAAYDFLLASTDRVVSVDADIYKVAQGREAGRNVHFADVEDASFWRGLRLETLRVVILAMDNIDAKVSAARALRRAGFDGPIVAHALYEEHLQQLADAGATHTYLTMQQAGIGLAEQSARAIDLDVAASYHEDAETSDEAT